MTGLRSIFIHSMIPVIPVSANPPLSYHETRAVKGSYEHKHEGIDLAEYVVYLHWIHVFKMRNILEKILSLVIASIFLVSAAGFSVFQHVCECDGEQHLSLIAESRQCHDAYETGEQEETGCCVATQVNIPVRGESCEETGDCCYTSSIFLKIEDYFIPREVDDLVQDVSALSSEVYTALHAPNSECATPERPHNPKVITPTGRTIIISNCQLKIPAYPVS